MNSSFAELIGLLLRLVRWKAGISQELIAELVSTSQPTVSRWERGSAIPQRAKIERWFSICFAASSAMDKADISLALATIKGLLNAPSDAIPEEKLEHGRRIIRQLVGQAASQNQALVPFFADVAAGCGEQQEALSSPHSYIEVPSSLKEQDPGCYAMRVVGDSMQPLLQPGDIVVVSPQAQPFDGAIVAAYLEPDGDIIKQYRIRSGGEIWLEPLNDKYPVISLKHGGEQTARIWGRVIFQQREL